MAQNYMAELTSDPSFWREVLHLNSVRTGLGESDLPLDELRLFAFNPRLSDFQRGFATCMLTLTECRISEVVYKDRITKGINKVK